MSVPRLLLSFCLTVALMAPAEARSRRVELLPKPMSVELRQGQFMVTAATPLVASAGDEGEAKAAAYFASLLGKAGGPQLRQQHQPAAGSITFRRDAAVEAEEGYRLTSGPDGVLITARTNAGLFYGAVTLWQLATGEQRWQIPALSISDAPRFRWRGLMLDSARHFQSPTYVRSLIDWMAVNKLNRLHWHLVDDQGWRIEIKKYPKLTAVSGSRIPASVAGAPKLPPISGFYTQDEIRSIVAYAAERQITIVPEIEMPGHALAAIRAYPELGTGTPITPGAESDWGVFPWLYNVDDSTFSFLEGVLDEVMELFPSTYIHVGGDEAVKDQWKANASIQARMRSLGISDETALQGWFIKRIEAYLRAHGRRLIGWDEILEGGIAPDATITSWRGVEGAVEAARTGHDAVLSPAPTLYLDNRQGWGPLEPPGRGNLISLQTVYDFDPLPAAVPAEQQHHILGLQGNLWTEHVRTEERAAWMMFPRGSAIAEIGWSRVEDRNFGDFVDRLIPQIERMRALGLNSAVSAFAVTPAVTFDPAAGRAQVALVNQVKLPIRYTLDGSLPSASSPLYGEPLSIAPGTRLRAASMEDGRVLQGELDRTYDARSLRRKSDEELQTCTKSVVLALEDDGPTDGDRATLVTDIFNPCWIYPEAPLAGATAIAIDVGQVPFNFQVGHDADHVTFAPPTTREGEFLVRAGGCKGDLIATLPLAPAVSYSGITRLTAAIAPRQGSAELCITYTAKGVEPGWAVNGVELIAP